MNIQNPHFCVEQILYSERAQSLLTLVCRNEKKNSHFKCYNLSIHMGKRAEIWSTHCLNYLIKFCVFQFFFKFNFLFWTMHQKIWHYWIFPLPKYSPAFRLIDIEHFRIPIETMPWKPHLIWVWLTHMTSKIGVKWTINSFFVLYNSIHRTHSS